MSVPTTAGAALWVAAFLGDGSAGPSAVFVALLTADPRLGGVEVTGAGYARVELANTDAVWSTVDDGVKVAAAAFPDPAGPWDEARWWAASDAVDTDEWCLAGALSQTVSVTAGDSAPIIMCNVSIDRDF